MWFLSGKRATSPKGRPNEHVAVDGKALPQFVRETLADYNVHRGELFLCLALPVNAKGKILKTNLRKLASAK